MNSKFILYNYAGKPVRHFLVEEENVANKAATPKQVPSHHIAVLDVSGSMYGDIDAVKSTLEKVFTAEEFNDPNQRVSLLTYSSHGDCRLHFKRVTVAEVMAPNSPHLQEIRNLHTRGLTGISQALVEAEKLVDDNEMTCISLHTDGYANDPSPFAEGQAILAAIQALEKHPGVFCNTVAYRSWCDFALLDAIANRLSGVCVRASSARQVYDALHQSQALLAGSVAPTIEAGIGNFDFITFVSQSGGKVLGGAQNLAVRGLSVSDDATVYRYREVSDTDYAASVVPVCGETSTSSTVPILAFCRVNLALGNINTAKYALVSARDTGLVAAHARALVASEIAALATGLEQRLFKPTTVFWNGTFGLGDTGPSILEVVQTLDKYRSSIRVNVEALGQSYKRRGLKRVAGARDDQGNLIPPRYRLSPKGDKQSVAVSDFGINRDTATINIRVVQDADLVGPNGVVTEVAGIPLDLKDYRNYTLVGDGAVNAPVLPVRIGDKRCFADLKGLGVVSGDFDPTAQYDLNLSDLPLVDYDQTFDGFIVEDFNNLVRLTVLQKVLSALTQGESESRTPEQVEALKEHHLSPALYFSAPSTTPYTDIKDALAKGEVDTRVTYKVKFGTPDILHLGKLYSGNAYLQRRFTLTRDGEEVAKPVLSDWWDTNTVWSVKALSSRTKVDGVDDLSYPIYEGFLGLGNETPLVNLLKLSGVESEAFLKAARNNLSRDEAVQVFKDALRKVDHTIESMYKGVTPIAFYVGATGLVPDQFDVQGMTADQLVAKHPVAKPGKAESEGLYYEISPGLLLGVFTESVHFSTDLGVKVASSLGSAED